MSDGRVPWKHARLKNLVGYRRWEAIKRGGDRQKKRQLLEALAAGRDILFIHIPKTAGVSLIRACEDSLADARHSPVLYYKRVLGRDFCRFKTFSVVRNPWARLFSAYNFLKRGGLAAEDPEMGRILNEQCPEFRQFVMEWLPAHGVCSYMHFVPQSEFICGNSGSILVEHVIRLEHLDAQWSGLAGRLGIRGGKLPRANAGGGDDYREYYDNDSMAMVGKLYSRDVRLLRYSFGE